MGKTIFVFHSTHDAIAAERACLRKGVSCQAIPVPRDITAECGIALEVDGKDKNAAAIVLEKESISADRVDR